jgi:hypothetical protein
MRTQLCNRRECKSPPPMSQGISMPTQSPQRATAYAAARMCPPCNCSLQSRSCTAPLQAQALCQLTTASVPSAMGTQLAEGLSFASGPMLAAGALPPLVERRFLGLLLPSALISCAPLTAALCGAPATAAVRGLLLRGLRVRRRPRATPSSAPAPINAAAAPATCRCPSSACVAERSAVPIHARGPPPPPRAFLAAAAAESAPRPLLPSSGTSSVLLPLPLQRGRADAGHCSRRRSEWAAQQGRLPTERMRWAVPPMPAPWRPPNPPAGHSRRRLCCWCRFRILSLCVAHGLPPRPRLH